MSFYFADSGKPLQTFEESILTATQEVRMLQRAGARFLAADCDAQVELPPKTDLTGPNALGAEHASGVANEGKSLMLNFLWTFQLEAATT